MCRVTMSPCGRDQAAPDLSLCLHSDTEFRFPPIVIHIVFVLCKERFIKIHGL